ncbi:hypothetical protein L6R50_13250 [Myxococcota bacterium]|nr:hypothetical protein [Myxococcota bacterium]
MAGTWKQWLRGLISPGSVRAREEGRWLAVDPTPGGYYDGRVMRFRAEGDLVGYPEYVWSNSPYWAARGGLSVHFEEVAESQKGAVYGDVLVVLSPETWKRGREDLLHPWEDRLRQQLEHAFGEARQKREWTLAHPRRPLTVQAIVDGGPEMHGATLGLEGAEFATVLSPNLYVGPGAESRPLFEVFVRLPSDPRAGERFRAVGTFWDDQLAFTVGAHWLDNGRVPALPCSALYTLHRYPGREGVNHHLSPEVQDRYVLQRAAAGGGEKVTIEDVESGDVLVEVMLIAAEGAFLGEIPGSTPSRGDPTPDLQKTFVPEDLPLGGGLTIIPDPEPTPTLVLSERAFLLQKVHFSEVMTGYRVDVGPAGEVAPSLPEPVGRFRVEGREVSFEPLRRDLTVDGLPVVAGRRIPLHKPEHRVAWGDVEVLYRALEHARDPRWPYLASVSVPSRSHGMPFGEKYSIGRDQRRCELTLPDRPGHANIHWAPGAGEGADVRTRGGRITRDRLTTDAIMVAGRHASLDLTGPVPVVRAASVSCAVFVRRGDGEVVRLTIAAGAEEGAGTELRPDDELLVGNSLFRVGLPPQPHGEGRARGGRGRGKTADLAAIARAALAAEEGEAGRAPAADGGSPEASPALLPAPRGDVVDVSFTEGPPATPDPPGPGPGVKGGPALAPPSEPAPSTASTGRRRAPPPSPEEPEIGPDDELPPLRRPAASPLPGKLPPWTEAPTIMGAVPVPRHPRHGDPPPEPPGEKAAAASRGPLGASDVPEPERAREALRRRGEAPRGGAAGSAPAPARDPSRARAPRGGGDPLPEIDVLPTRQDD